MVRHSWPAALLAVAIAACSGSSTPTGAPAAALTGPAAATSVVATPRPSHASTPAPAAPTPSPSPSLPALKLDWERSGPIVGKTVTYWPAIDPKTGEIWVADSFHDQYWIFKPDGTYVGSWGSSGSGNGQFHLSTNDVNPDPVGAIAFAPDGSFYVADEGNYRVQKFDASRRYVTQWGEFGTGNGQFVQAKGIATDGKYVYVTDDPRQDMQVFDANGTFIRSFPFPFVLFSLAPDGHLFSTTVASPATTIGIYDTTGKLLNTLDISAETTALGGPPGWAAVDKAGNIYVSLDNDPDGPVGIIELDKTGKLLHEWSNGCGEMALSADGKAAYCAYDGPPDGGWGYINKYLLPAP